MKYWFVRMPTWQAWHVADADGELVEHEVDGKMYVTEYASEADVLAAYPEATLCEEMHNS